VIAVVTNIDADHMETYGHDFARLKQAFVDFLQHLPFYGAAILCEDDRNVREIMPFVSKPIVRYGLAETAHIRAEDVRHEGAQMKFSVLRPGSAPKLDIVLNLPGVHNVLNALAAIAVADEVGVPTQPSSRRWRTSRASAAASSATARFRSRPAAASR
jgi:UDP-N-acetylmuramate--alanine ligase